MLTTTHNLRSTNALSSAPFRDYTLAPSSPRPLNDCPPLGVGLYGSSRYISMSIADGPGVLKGCLYFDITNACPGKSLEIAFRTSDCMSDYSVTVVFPKPVIGSHDSPYKSVIEYIYDQLVNHPLISSSLYFSIDEDYTVTSGSIYFQGNSALVHGEFSVCVDECTGTATITSNAKSLHDCGCDNAWLAGAPVGRDLNCDRSDAATHFEDGANCCTVFVGFAANSARGGSCNCLRVLTAGTTSLPWSSALPMECLNPEAMLIYKPSEHVYSMINSREVPPTGWVAVTTHATYAGCCSCNPGWRKVTIHGGL